MRSQTRSITLCSDARVTEHLEKRLALERHFLELGHTYRHGKLHRVFEKHVTRRMLKLGLQTAGLYQRGLRNALSPVLRRVPMCFSDLPDEFDGYRILHLSDFHVDGADGLAEALAEAVAPLRPDVCVLTGDYRFEDRGPAEAVYPRMEAITKSIRAKDGVLGILGNHDAGEAVGKLENMGVQMLVNDAVEIRRHGSAVWIAGVDDNFDYQLHDLEAAFRSVPREAFKVLLAHAPESYPEAAEYGVHLYLCGHTHAGQIRVPWLGSLKHNARCPRAYAQGHWRRGAMQGYTSAGVGCSSLPIRFNCPPELVMIELYRQRR